MWCNASIRVLGTVATVQFCPPRPNASLVQSGKTRRCHRRDTGSNPVRCSKCPCSLTEERFASNESVRVQVLSGFQSAGAQLLVCAFSPQSVQHRKLMACSCGSDVTGNMRVFKLGSRVRCSPSAPKRKMKARDEACRFNASLSSSAFILHPLTGARRQAAKAPDCKSGIREFESRRALQFLNHRVLMNTANLGRARKRSFF